MKRADTDMVRRADMARFLGCEPEEVERMANEDNLPHVKMPGATRPSYRFFLPDVHGWLVKYAKGPCSLADYGKFRESFRRLMK